MKKNKKVKNAKPNLHNGIKFRSKLETYCYKELDANFPSEFEYEKNRYTLLKGFEYNGEKIRPITIKPDFVSNKLKVIIEIKGYPNDAWPLRLKLFKKLLSTKLKDYQFFICKNQTEVNQLIKKLKDENRSI